MNDAPKYKIIQNQILDEIAAGKYILGEQLPSERVLADRYNVSRMTARRAVVELVQQEFLEQRDRDGIYLTDRAQQRLACTNVNVICGSYESSTAKAFLNACGRQCLERGWNDHVIRYHEDYARKAAEVIRSGEPCLLLADFKELHGMLGKAIQSPRANIVIIGLNLSSLGFPSVLADDMLSTRMATNYLIERGHERIGFFCHNLERSTEQVMYNSWLSSLPDVSDDVIKKCLVEIKVPPFECAVEYAYDRMKKLIKAGLNFTSLLTLSDETAIGILAACRDLGVSVPRELSVISLQESAMTAFANPRITCVDVDIESHVSAAIEMLGSIIQGDELKQKLKLIHPRLVERESVGLVREFEKVG